MTASLPTDRRTVPALAIIGNDAVLAAAPATPVQLAHACLQCGFSVAVPASWGDELVAGETIRRLATREKGPTVMCVCPYVRSRLLAPGPDLAPFLLSLLPPPVAVARYLRAAYGDHGIHITYVGGCPGADDSSIDVHLTPDAFLAEIAERGIALSEQPLVFDSIVPPDRRRWCSLPGGVPSADVLWNESNMRTLVEIDSDDPSTELAQHIITAEHVLLDLAPSLGCACSGAISTQPSRSARVAVTALEPPRALAPVIDAAPSVSLDAPVRTAIEAARELPRERGGETRSEGSMSKQGAGTVGGSVERTIPVGIAHAGLDATEAIAAFVQVSLASSAGVTVEPGTTSTPESVADLLDEYLPRMELVESHAGPPASDLSASAARSDVAEIAQTHPVEDAAARYVEAVTDHTDAREADVSDESSPPSSVDAGVVGEPGAVRRRTPQATRPVAGIPRATSGDGRLLPRAYVAKRRAPAVGTPVIVAAARREAGPPDAGEAPASGTDSVETQDAIVVAPPIVPADPVPSAAGATPLSAAATTDAGASVIPVTGSASTRSLLVLLLVAALVVLGVFVLFTLRR